LVLSAISNLFRVSTVAGMPILLVRVKALLKPGKKEVVGGRGATQTGGGAIRS
jgi:hypothetical protein